MSMLETIKEKIYNLYNETIGSLIRSLFPTQVGIIFVGVDNAGKTTLVNILKEDSSKLTIPTLHPNSTKIEIGNMTAQIFDLGGHSRGRLGWGEYFHTCDAVVYIVDVGDQDRYHIVQKEFSNMRKVFEERQLGVPILVFMNKMDLAKEIQLEKGINLGQFKKYLLEETGIKDEVSPPVKVSYCSMHPERNTGKFDDSIMAGFNWLNERINEAKLSAQKL